MSVMLMIPRKSENSLTIVNDSRLTYYQVTDWDIKVIIVLWVLFLVTSVFVFLRLYSRVKILQFYAAEDYLYNIAFTLLLAYNAIITFYSYHGLGSQLPDVMTTADVKLAVVFENVLFDLASIGLIVAKSSLIVFLMRLVPQHHSPVKWRLMIIGPLAVLGVVSLGSIMTMWARCFGELSGAEALCDDITPAMHWMQVTAGVSVAVDLWYAAMPWYLLRRLTRPRREKVLVQGSMSLGVIAAGCGIARAVTIYPALNNSEASSAAILYMWHGAEMAVTMICIGMPVCRPAVSSMLQACGLGPRSKTHRTTNKELLTSNNNHHHHPHHPHHQRYTPTSNNNNNTTTSSSYIRNYGGGTWEEAVGADGPADFDSWSQRRILGVGDATSNATSTTSTKSSSAASTTTTTMMLSLSSKEAEAGGGGGGGAFDVYPLAALSKTGITVTKTVDITEDERILP